MDAREQIDLLNAEISDIDVRLGRFDGLLAAARREAERIENDRRELEELRRRKEAARQGLLRSLGDGSGQDHGGRHGKAKKIPPSVQSLIRYLFEKGCAVDAPDVAAKFNISVHNARTRLWKGTATGEVVALGDGKYAHVSVVAAMTASAGAPQPQPPS